MMKCIYICVYGIYHCMHALFDAIMYIYIVIILSYMNPYIFILHSIRALSYTNIKLYS